MSWFDLCMQWPLVEADLHSHFGIDTWDDDLMNRRPWEWLRRRILALLSANTRITRWARERSEKRKPNKMADVADLIDLGSLD